MPPKNKKQDNKPKAEKVKVDKTFGMSNKKGGKAQKQIAVLKAQEAQAGQNKEARAKDKAKANEAKRKESEIDHKRATAELFAQVPQKVPFGVDPKSVVCQYHKAGYCEKGRKCKFSHDLNVNRKGEKADVYTDARTAKEEDLMENWDENKLKEVVLSKHGNPKSTTDIVCMHFLAAIENQKYGWFWTCPSGESCKYRHALPPGFVLKPKGKKKEDDENPNAISIEEFLEVERHKLPAKLTPVTPESFAEWKKNRVDKKAAEQDALKKSKETQIQAGKAGGMSGRDLFEFNPELYNDSDDEGDDEDWDIAAFRKRTEDERDEFERRRMEAMGHAPTSQQPPAADEATEAPEQPA